MACVEEPREALLTELLPGRMIWDFIDPRRTGFAPEVVENLLEEYGECLARIHALKIDWAPQVRGLLYQIKREDFSEYSNGTRGDPERL